MFQSSHYFFASGIIFNQTVSGCGQGVKRYRLVHSPNVHSCISKHISKFLSSCSREITMHCARMSFNPAQYSKTVATFVMKIEG